MNFMNRLVKKKVEQRIAIILGQRTPEQEAMYQEQLRIRKVLGYEESTDPQNWLRLHQILMDYENRLTDLETRDADNE